MTAEWREWYRARHVFLEEDPAAGLALARTCSHPDAVWLTSVFSAAAADEVTEARARAALLAPAHSSDLRAVYFAWCVGGRFQLPCREVQRAAEGGLALAQATVAAWPQTEVGERLRLARAAAAPGEPRGMTHLAWLLLQSESRGQEKREAEAAGLLEEAAERGDGWAALQRSELSRDESCRVEWLGRSAALGCRAGLLRFRCVAVEQVARYGASGDNGRAVFQLGAACAGQLRSNGALFGRRVECEEQFRSLARAIALHRDWCAAARAAVWLWTGVAGRLRIPRDLRKLIGELVWADRAVWSEKRPGERL